MAANHESTKGQEATERSAARVWLSAWRWRKHELIEVIWQLLRPKGSAESLEVVEQIKDKLDNEPK
jgi:hypothetical protein